MAFFNDLGKKLSQAGQTTMQKTKELADIAKLNSMIADEEKRINHAYTDIGKLYFEHHAKDNDEMFSSSIQSINEANEKIVNLKNQTAEIKGIVKCEKCGAEVAKNAAFCGACGNPMPVTAHAPAEQKTTEEASETAPEQAPIADSAPVIQEQTAAAESTASTQMPDSANTI